MDAAKPGLTLTLETLAVHAVLNTFLNQLSVTQLSKPDRANPCEQTPEQTRLSKPDRGTPSLGDGFRGLLEPRHQDLRRMQDSFIL